MTFTSIATFLRRWIEVLTVTYFAGRDAWRARQSLTIACESGRFIVRRSRQDSRSEPPDEPGENLAVLAAGAPIPAKVARAARGAFVVFQLPDDMVVVRRIAVPVQAREFLPGIIRNQIERLSPWHADQVVYGFAADVDEEDAATLDVRVLIALRTDIDRARDELAAIGLPVDRIVTPPARAGEGRVGAKSVTLWSRAADVSPERRAHACRRVGAAVAAAVMASLALTLWAVTSAISLGGESDEVAARVRTLQRQIQGPASQSVASLSPSERAWYAKETSPTAAIVLEALSRALPDGAYVTELRLENAISDGASLASPTMRSV